MNTVSGASNNNWSIEEYNDGRCQIALIRERGEDFERIDLPDLSHDELESLYRLLYVHFYFDQSRIRKPMSKGSERSGGKVDGLKAGPSSVTESGHRDPIWCAGSLKSGIESGTADLPTPANAEKECLKWDAPVCDDRTKENKCKCPRRDTPDGCEFYTPPEKDPYVLSEESIKRMKKIKFKTDEELKKGG